MKAYSIEDPAHIVSEEGLAKIGILHWALDADNWEAQGILESIRKERGYKNHDVITISRDVFGESLEGKLKIFFEEHLHDDEEIRFILDGSGFFDVRGKDDQWIRIHVLKGDLIILPKGIYHRFTLDDERYIKAMRLFQDEPKWTPVNRAIPSTDSSTSRQEYVKSFIAVS